MGGDYWAENVDLNLERMVKCEACLRWSPRCRWRLVDHSERSYFDMATLREITYRDARVICPHCNHEQTKGQWLKWAMERRQLL